MLLAGIIALGAAGLWRARGLAGLVTGCLGLGTPVVAALTSLISPGFAPRTVIYATLGWALLVCATVTALPEAPRLRRWQSLGIGAAGVAVVLALATLVGLLRDGDKQHWRELAGDMSAAARVGGPILVVRPVAYTLLDLYAPGVLATRAISDVTEPAGHQPARRRVVRQP